MPALALVMAAAAATAAGAAPTVAGDDVTAPMIDEVLVGDDPVVVGPAAAERVESSPTPFVFKLTVTLMAPMVVSPTENVVATSIGSVLVADDEIRVQNGGGRKGGVNFPNFFLFV